MSTQTLAAVEHGLRYGPKALWPYGPRHIITSVTGDKQAANISALLTTLASSDSYHHCQTILPLSLPFLHHMLAHHNGAHLSQIASGRPVDASDSLDCGNPAMLYI